MNWQKWALGVMTTLVITYGGCAIDAYTAKVSDDEVALKEHTKIINEHESKIAVMESDSARTLRAVERLDQKLDDLLNEERTYHKR